MFTKGPKEATESLGLNRQDSSEVLHKSQSLKMLGSESHVSVAPSGITANANSSSVAARMMARKANTQG